MKLQLFGIPIGNSKPQMEIQPSANGGGFSFRKKNTAYFEFAFWVLALISIPSLAHAEAAWEGALKTIVDYVTGSTARYIAILAVVGFGFAAFLGRVSWKRALEIVVAIAVVFGAAKIVDMFAGSGN